MEYYVSPDERFAIDFDVFDRTGVAEEAERPLTRRGG
jgi:hypothetical protein